jgi:amidophosphoribosyltransferase
MLDKDKIHDECGFWYYNHKSAPNWIYLGLYALQHRGQKGQVWSVLTVQVLTSHRGRSDL